MPFLDKIIANKKKEIELARQRRPVAYLKSNLSRRNRINGLYSKLSAQEEFVFICEVKKASPSRGIIREDFDPVSQALIYAESGAAAISVLTDEQFFKGSLTYLPRIRKKVTLPLLRKDFIIDSYQIYETAHYQADIILLIARILTSRQIAEFTKIAADLGLEIMVEVASQEDLVKIPPADVGIIIEVNNRDLKTFEVNLDNSLRIKSLLPAQYPAVSASGISTAADCVAIKQWGYAGVLIGESLMRSENPKVLLKEFRRGVKDAG